MDREETRKRENDEKNWEEGNGGSLEEEIR